MEDQDRPSTRNDKRRELEKILNTLRAQNRFFGPIEDEIRALISKSTCAGDAHDLAFQEIHYLWRDYRRVCTKDVSKALMFLRATAKYSLVYVLSVSVVYTVLHAEFHDTFS